LLQTQPGLASERWSGLFFAQKFLKEARWSLAKRLCKEEDEKVLAGRSPVIF